MVFRRFRKRAAPKRARKYSRRPRARTTRKVGRTFAAKVKKVIHRMAENKVLQQEASNESITPCDGVTATPYFINMLPAVSQGVAQSQRVGDQIRLMSNKISGYINLRPYNATTNPYVSPIIVKMWVVSWKYANAQFTLPSLTDFSTFFQVGSSTANFIGNPLDMCRTVNTDVWTIHKTKSFELSVGGSYNIGTPVSGQNPSGVYSHKYYLDVGKYAKLLKFNDTIAPQRPSNRNLYLVIQTVRADGTSVAAGDVYCENHYSQSLTFEDL